MKKLLSLILVVLLVFSFASCSKDVDAKELYVEATNNTKSFDFDMDMEMTLTESGITTAMTMGFDGTVDENNNLKATYMIGDGSMNLTGEMYFLMDSMEMYMQLMGMWISMDIDETLTALGMSMDELLAETPEEVTAESLDEVGYTFGDVTEKDGVYSFDLGLDKAKFEDALKAELAKQEGMDEATIDAVIQQTIPMFNNFKVKVEINKSGKTLKSISADLAPMMKDMMDAVGEGLEGVSYDKCSMVMNIANVGKTEAVTVSDTIKNNSMDMMTLLSQMMNELQF